MCRLLTSTARIAALLANQPGVSRGHFLCSAPYTAKPSLTALPELLAPPGPRKQTDNCGDYDKRLLRLRKLDYVDPPPSTPLFSSFRVPKIESISCHLENMLEVGVWAVSQVIIWVLFYLVFKKKAGRWDKTDIAPCFPLCHSSCCFFFLSPPCYFF